MRCMSLMLLVAIAAAVPLLGCATPEELAVLEQRRERQVQTGSNIVRRDTSGARTDVVSNKDSMDAVINDMRNVGTQSQVPQGAGR
jgi:hypothetical protein